jgi:hypothetical protein
MREKKEYNNKREKAYSSSGGIKKRSAVFVST